jgi:hypothetical protein
MTTLTLHDHPSNVKLEPTSGVARHWRHVVPQTDSPALLAISLQCRKGSRQLETSQIIT